MKNTGFSFTTFLRQALTMVDYGNAIFEKVFETLPDSKKGRKRLLPRMSRLSILVITHISEQA